MLMLPAGLLAEQGAHGGGSASDLIVYWVNFLIYAGILFFLLRKPFVAAWLKRREQIESEVQGARSEMEAAEFKLHQARARLQGIGAEISRISQDSERATVIESEEILSLARRRADRFVQRVKEACNAERRTAELSVQHEIAELAVNLAREKLRQASSFDSDRPLREATLGQIGRLLH